MACGCVTVHKKACYPDSTLLSITLWVLPCRVLLAAFVSQLCEGHPALPHKMTEIREQILKEAANAFERSADDPEVARRIEALLAKLDNGLPDEAVLEQLRVFPQNSNCT